MGGTTKDTLLRDLALGSMAKSGGLVELVLKKIIMNILEMEDVLFHLNSAIMMPERPKGASSTQGTPQPKQDKISGIQALAVTFKQFEFDPRKRLLIAGHTDTSGDAAMNFELSQQRADNILHLLEGNRDKWAEVSRKRQRIEDYQQIMKFLFENKRWGWSCDPIQIDNKWGDNSKSATDCFQEDYNAWVASGKAPAGATPLPNDFVLIVDKDPKHEWPEEGWKAVFDVYNTMLAEALQGDIGQLNTRYRPLLKFVGVDDLPSASKQAFLWLFGWLFKSTSSEHKTVACGESFPIDKAEKNNYRSQTNRRVVLLFFDQDEIPVIDCPTRTSTVHTPEECPIWHKLTYIPAYIDPNDLTAVAYHLKFVYYDRIYQDWKDIPEGLSLKVLEDGDKEVNAQVVYSKGEYIAKVQDSKTRKKINFRFDADDLWVYTKDTSTAPKILTRKALETELGKEMKDLTFPERLKCYDLPARWSSVNYWTRYDNDMKKGERFEKVLKDVKKIKPYGSASTQVGQPLVFSLDDIVLVDGNRSQVLSDKKPDDSVLALDDKSRYTLFHVDYKQTKQNVGGVEKTLERLLKIHDPDPDQPVFTSVKFQTNLITDVPGNTRIVYFCNNFYDVYGKRSHDTDTAFDLAKGHVTGARLAMLNDLGCHGSHAVIASNADDRTKGYALTDADNIIGNYELHYFHNCAEMDGKALSYLMIYWNCRLQVKAMGKPNESAAGDVTNHRKIGMTTAMERLNKDYLIEKVSGTHELAIRPFHFMEAKNDTNGGKHKCMVDVVGDYPNSGAWMNIGVAQFRTGDYKSDPTYLGNPDPNNNVKDTDGRTYEVLTNHHEMGHATGNPDHYLYDFKDTILSGAPAVATSRVWGGLPKFNPPFTADGGPFSCDVLSRMNVNRTPRLGDFWKFVCWLHDASSSNDPTKPEGALTRFIGGNKFKITFKAKTFTHNFVLEDKHKNVFKPGYRGDNTVLSSATPAGPAKADLLLYKLGDSETAYVIKSGHTFKGILVVKLKLGLKFINIGAGVWDFATKLAWVRGFDEKIRSMANLKFYLKCAKTNELDDLYIFVVPHYTIYEDTETSVATPKPADSHLNFEVRFQIGNSYTLAGNTYTCDWGLSQAAQPDNHAAMSRRCLGFEDAVASFSKTSFPKIVDWVNAQDFANDVYAVKDL
jgi:hypothetical protein